MGDDNATGWPPQWLRGVLEIATLSVVARGPTYGYQVVQELDRAGLGRIGGGTLYPLLNRLEEDGALTSSWHEGQGGPGRKYFAVTEAGRRRLGGHAREWIDFAQRTITLLQDSAEVPHDR